MTVRVLGSQRSSSASSVGRKTARGRGHVCVRRRSLGPDRFQFRSQEENPMMLLLSGTGLRYNKNAIAAGAQTERRGGRGPVRGLLGGRTSPAAFVFQPRALPTLSPSPPGRRAVS